MAEWQPIETCPDNTTVIFWDNGPRIGRMEHATERLGGQRQDHFWGDLFDDDQPPTYWTPLPDPPTAQVKPPFSILVSVCCDASITRTHDGVICSKCGKWSASIKAPDTTEVEK